MTNPGPIQISGDIRLRPDREHAVRRRHPWIFSGAMVQPPGNITDGSWVRVVGHKGEVLGHGHYQKGSISVRLLSFGPDSPNSTLWESKLATALQQRISSRVTGATTNSYRLVHAEGDGLPGLIVDIYNGVAVMQSHSHGMHADREAIAAALQQVMGTGLTAVYYKSTLEKGAGSYLVGMGGTPHVIEEHGHKFLVDWEEGQKTGFFLDQRENRKLLGDFASGQKVLNTFCYSGGFSVYALNNGASLVHSVDSSEKAIELTRQNLQLNGHSPDKHGCFAMDTFEFLSSEDTVYDIIVLDPPAFAKHKEARHQAVKGYQRLNAEAMKVIRPNGLLFTFSCSQVVDRQLFYDTIVSAAHQSGRTVKCLYHLSQPADHPVSLFHPEGEYLKGLVLMVE